MRARMTRKRPILSRISPLVDLFISFFCAYIAPDLTNMVAPLFGWQTQEDFNLITTTPFVVGAAVAAVPVVLRLVGFYHRGNLQRTASAARQLCTFCVYYLCAIAIYQATRVQGDYFYLNHTILVCMIILPIALFLRFLLFRWLLVNTARGRQHLRSVLLAGSAEDIERGWSQMSQHWMRSMQVAGRAIAGETSRESIQQMIEENHVEQLLLFGGLDAYEPNKTAVSLCELQGIDVYIMLRNDHAASLRANIADIEDNRALIISSTPVYSWAQLCKSIMDRVLAFIAIIGTSPLWLVAAIGIRCSDPNGPIFYRQMRSGLHGKPFAMWKFRSMYADADKRLDEIKAKYGNEMDGPIFKLTNDPRIFKFGHFIRKTSIDELPQLINILCGHMSIVGPRPLPTYETAKFPDIWNRRRLSVKPGLTCYWQVEDRSDTAEFSTMVKKDLKYIDNWSLWLDISLILRTIPAVLFGKGAK